MPTITLRDATTAGKTAWNGSGELTLDLLTEILTVRELLRARVYQEVQDFNRRQQSEPAATFRGLIQPTDAETTLNGYHLRAPRQIDWKPQFEKACDAFDARHFLLLIDNYQPTSLDEKITLSLISEVTFLRLTPLVGG